MSGERRTDPLSGRTVVLAPGRARRPGAARAVLEPPSAEELASCPFCEGREERTPPETLAFGAPGRAPDSPGWRVRVVPNLYPAFARQEVVIHTPRHARSLAELEPAEARAVAQAWRARAETTRAGGVGTYLHALVNEGREAGASLAHSHSQLVWLDEEPPAVRDERLRANDGCGACVLVAQELEAAARVVVERDGLVALCPYAGRGPYELLVAPVAHEPDAFASEMLEPALELVVELVRRLHAVEGPRPLNLWLHGGPHWHIELLPRLGVLAGVELGAGVYINSLAPEEGAAALRAATP